MRVVILRAQLNPDMASVFQKRWLEMHARASEAPGFISATLLTAAEANITILVEFDTEKHMIAWTNDREALLAMEQGRDHFFKAFTIQVLMELETSELPLQPAH